MNKFYFYFLLLIHLNLNSQDFHFSQFYASPLTLNPALTGKFNGNIRTNAIYRMQWSNISTSGGFLYQTPSASIDFNLLKQKLGFGLVVLNDQTNNKTFNTLEGGVSASYKINFEKIQISVGLQGWYSQNYFDYNKVSQGFFQSEPSTLQKITKFDFHSGIFGDYKLENDKGYLYMGAAVYHILKPNDYFSDIKKSSSLPLKGMIQFGADINMSEKINIIPGLFYARQAGASQINTGCTIAYYLKRDEDMNHTILFFGLWSRLNELKAQAFIPKFGIEYNKIRITASYDYVLNSLNSETQSANSKIPNTFEVSLNYIFNLPNKSLDYDCYLFNPRF